VKHALRSFSGRQRDSWCRNTQGGQNVTRAASLHKPVLLDEVLSFYEPASGQRCLDATLGLGGHSEALLNKAREAKICDVVLLGLDRDPSALELARERLSPFGGMVQTFYLPFSECDQAVASLGWQGVDFILADIGVSSMQLDMPERGFSFMADGPLDMRMDTGAGITAETLVNTAPETELRKLIDEYGEEPMAARIAKSITDARQKRRITTTLELAGLVEQAYPQKWRRNARNHPATRTFQALRLAVNSELSELKTFLIKAVSLLNPGGRLAVISFHSLEDRIVKHFFREQATGCRCPKHVPYCVCNNKPSLKILTRKPVGPSERELVSNSRSKSAKLRVAEKVKHD
jgi:S-adenosyl-methyltransferase MraW